MANGDAGLIGLLGLLGSTRRPKDGAPGLPGLPGARGPGLEVLATEDRDWLSPAVQSPVSSIVTTQEAPLTPPPGATHFCAILVFQQETQQPFPGIICLSNGIMFLPVQPGPLVPQIQWWLQTQAPLQGGEIRASASIAWLRQTP